MVENGQYEAAIKPLVEGLAKYPDNPWLLTRKALIEVHLKQFDTAKESLRALIKKEPGHLGATILMTRLLMESEGATAAIAQFQQGLSAMAPERRGELAPLASLLGISLCRSGFPIAGFKHLELVQKWGGPSDDPSVRAIASLKASPALSTWDKNPYHLWPAPEGVGDQFRESFEHAPRLGRGGPLGVRRVGVRAAGRRVVRRRDRRSQPGDLLPLDRRHRWSHRVPAALRRPDRPLRRGGQPRGDLSAGRAAADRRSRRVRPLELADPEPGGAPGRPASRRVLRARA